MLYVFVAEGGPFVHQPAYKLSDAVNQRETVEAARAGHTIDGNRRWKPATFLLTEAAGQLSLECDHCRAKVHVDSIAADIAAATRQPSEIQLSNNTVR
ncbi:hypothetical protein [Mycobacterium sp. 141]|uniref:hypothetical protein n=1 Tax=Mycobacterium sp. 141 TaxID=1120797 RepID=UPI0003696B42|nr:hypothetical protein [Mycobacterium sp. 141]